MAAANTHGQTAIEVVFTQGRLDWILYSDSTLKVVNAFTLDTARLSDAALERMGFERDDSRASDHLPVVVDVASRT